MIIMRIRMIIIRIKRWRIILEAKMLKHVRNIGLKRLFIPLLFLFLQCTRRLLLQVVCFVFVCCLFVCFVWFFGGRREKRREREKKKREKREKRERERESID